jgi:hypothetical protein
VNLPKKGTAHFHTLPLISKTLKLRRPLAFGHNRSLAYGRQHGVQFAGFNRCDDRLDRRDELFLLADRNRRFALLKLDGFGAIAYGQHYYAGSVSTPPCADTLSEFAQLLDALFVRNPFRSRKCELRVLHQRDLLLQPDDQLVAALNYGVSSRQLGQRGESQ